MQRRNPPSVSWKSTSLLEVEDLHDVRVVEAHREARLVDEHLPHARGLVVCGKNPLHDDELLNALGAAGAREIHLGHSAGTEPPNDVVATELHRDLGARRSTIRA
jgi:hypothetical protein